MISNQEKMKILDNQGIELMQIKNELSYFLLQDRKYLQNCVFFRSSSIKDYRMNAVS